MTKVIAVAAIKDKPSELIYFQIKEDNTENHQKDLVVQVNTIQVEENFLFVEDYFASLGLLVERGVLVIYDISVNDVVTDRFIKKTRKKQKRKKSRHQNGEKITPILQRNDIDKNTVLFCW